MPPVKVKRRLSLAVGGGKVAGVTGKRNDTTTREERLATKLRENLRRRKAQGRELQGCRPNADDESLGDTLSNVEEGG